MEQRTQFAHMHVQSQLKELGDLEVGVGHMEEHRGVEAVLQVQGRKGGNCGAGRRDSCIPESKQV